jgi:PAS domain S-box-containing protein
MQTAVAAGAPRASASEVPGFDRPWLAVAATLTAGAFGALALSADQTDLALYGLGTAALLIAASAAVVVRAGSNLRRDAIAAVDRATQEAKQSQQRLADALEAVSEAVALYDQNDRLVICNSPFRRLNAGIDDLIVAGASLRDLITGAAERGLVVPQHAETGASPPRPPQPEGSAEINYANGAWVRRTSRRTQDGASVFVFADFTELRETEAALARSEARCRGLLDGWRDAVVIHDGERILYANAAAASLYGAVSSTDLVGRDPALLIHPEDRREAIRRDIERSGADVAIETRRRFRLDGGVIDTETTSLRIDWNDRQCTLEASRDTSELSQAKAEAARLHEALERRPDADLPRSPGQAGGSSERAAGVVVDISQTPAAGLPPAARDAFIRKLAQVYLDHGTKDMERLSAAVRGGDATAVAIRAHGLKSSSTNVGAYRLAELCSELEAAARAGTDTGFGELFSRISREFDAVRDHLTAQIEGPAAANA